MRPPRDGLLGELGDALARRQKELPPRIVAALLATETGRDAQSPENCGSEPAEVDLVGRVLAANRDATRPRGIVSIAASRANDTWRGARPAFASGSAERLAIIELDPSLARQAAERFPVECPEATSVSTCTAACDPTVELLLPHDFPRPRLYLCLGNALGAMTTVGAIRTLRVTRSTMLPRDALLLGVAIRQQGAAAPAPRRESASSAGGTEIRLLSRVNERFGAEFDPSAFLVRSLYDAENHRMETHLVARRSLQVPIAGLAPVSFRKGESLRASVRSVFDRGRLAAMLAGVGLSLQAWTPDARGTHAVALATPAC